MVAAGRSRSSDATIDSQPPCDASQAVIVGPSTRHGEELAWVPVSRRDTRDQHSQLVQPLAQ